MRERCLGKRRVLARWGWVGEGEMVDFFSILLGCAPIF